MRGVGAFWKGGREEAGRLKIRRMDHGDIGFAFELTTAEKWGYAEAEFERMLQLDPEGSFVLEDAGDRQGVVTTASYGRTGVVGHLVVSKDKRGAARGKTLMRAALAYLDARGVDSVLVNAMIEATRFYERFGFRVLLDMSIMKATVCNYATNSSSSLCSRLTEADLPGTLALDAELLGDRREEILRRLLAESPSNAFKLERDGRIVGFAFGRKVLKCSDIGPWLCVSGDREDAQQLLDSVIQSMRPDEVYAASFSSNTDAVSMIQALGPTQTCDTKMMVRGAGRYGDSVKSIYAIAATEFG